MKILKPLFTLLTFTILIYSCSSDDGENNDANKNLAEEQNKLEDAAITLARLNSDITIEGASKNVGTPPQPNSNLDFQISSNNFEAVQNSGFNLKFSSTETNIAGAYILFKDLDNNTASEYFDIPVSSFNTGKIKNTKNNTKSKQARFSNIKKTNEDGDYEIDIDFEDSFPAGQFCGDLCIYDSENNVGQIVSICVEVEAWGGNASIVGEWIYESGSDDDDTIQIDCENGQSIEVLYDDIISEEFIFVVENDGDFKLDSKEEYRELDFNATRNGCTAIYHNEIKEYDDRETGKWAYNEVNKTLTLVSFKYEDFIEPQYNEEYPNGELLFEGDSVEIINGKLVITESYVEEGETYIETYTFRRK